MEIQVCPNCRVRVIPSSHGECPSCRQASFAPEQVKEQLKTPRDFDVEKSPSLEPPAPPQATFHSPFAPEQAKEQLKTPQNFHVEKSPSLEAPAPPQATSHSPFAPEQAKEQLKTPQNVDVEKSPSLEAPALPQATFHSPPERKPCRFGDDQESPRCVGTEVSWQSNLDCASSDRKIGPPASMTEPSRSNRYRTVAPDKPLNPWFSIWTRPRATTRQRLDRGTIGAGLLAIFAHCMVYGIIRANNATVGDFLDYPGIFAFVFTVGTLALIVTWLLGSWWLGVVGRLLGGVATAKKMRIALAWAHVPGAWLLLPTIAVVLICGKELFIHNVTISPATTIAIDAYNALLVVFNIWVAILYCKCIAEAHEFSAWRGLGTVLLGAFMPLFTFIAAIVLAAFTIHIFFLFR